MLGIIGGGGPFGFGLLSNPSLSSESFPNTTVFFLSIGLEIALGFLGMILGAGASSSESPKRLFLPFGIGFGYGIAIALA